MAVLEKIRNGALKGAKQVRINEGLSEFPVALYDLADSLEVIDLCDNQLTSLPDDMGRFQRLKAIFLFNNHFELIPAVLADCPALDVYGFRYNRIRTLDPSQLPQNLRWLILTGNQLQDIPVGLGRLQKLQKCMLAGNQLKALPADIAQCKRLELLRISANKLAEFPLCVLDMPALTWLAYAGNPFCETQRPDLPQLHAIDWRDLTLENELGQGASGVIYKAQWRQSENVAQDVAVKMFKGEMTSDGSPMDERDACILAAQHPHLVPLLGSVADHPQGKSGLVLGLIPPHYKNMAGPPNIETCTRDTYPEGTQFRLYTILKVTAAMASVCQHLHARGIMHGDFYPHNTLLTEQGDCLLSDFGAASCFDLNDGAQAKGVARMEVRAIGCALDDMLRYCNIEVHKKNNEPRKIEDAFDSFTQLRDACLTPQVENRPSFTEIKNSVNDIALMLDVQL